MNLTAARAATPGRRGLGSCCVHRTARRLSRSAGSSAGRRTMSPSIAPSSPDWNRPHNSAPSGFSIRGDSELIIKQMRGEYRVKNPDLRELYDEAQALLASVRRSSASRAQSPRQKQACRQARQSGDGSSAGCDRCRRFAHQRAGSPARRRRASDSSARCGCEITVEKPSSIRPHQLKPFVCQCGNKMNRKSEAPRSANRASRHLHQLLRHLDPQLFAADLEQIRANRRRTRRWSLCGFVERHPLADGGAHFAVDLEHGFAGEQREEIPEAPITLIDIKQPYERSPAAPSGAVGTI